MASPSYVESLFGPLPADQRSVWKRVWDYVLNGLQFGPVSHQSRATNFQAYWLTGTTHETANMEFSIEHGLGRTPYLAIPVLPLDSVGAQAVGLVVTRSADAYRVYLRSASTSAAVALLVE
jgi:hypothetical protein